ncbi:unnamed protein product [Ectocarpus sp. CCAP 1310/34]|nr:unnamed protein product [Ectocarpus sp. CCAP 1310/34]
MGSCRTASSCRVSGGGCTSCGLSKGFSGRRRKRRLPNATAALAAIGALLTGRPDAGQASRSSGSGAGGAAEKGLRGRRQQSRGAFALLQHGDMSLRGRSDSSRRRRRCEFSPLPISTAGTTYSSSRRSSCGSRLRRLIRPCGPMRPEPLLSCSAVERDACSSPVRTWGLSLQLDSSGRDGEDFVEGHTGDRVARSARRRRRRRRPEEEDLSLTAATRRRRRELESTWLEDPGEDVPFEFADLHQATSLPCNIQLFPRVDRRSIVFVDGKESRSYRGKKYTATAGVGRMDDEVAAASSRSSSSTSRKLRLASVSAAAMDGGGFGREEGDDGTGKVERDRRRGGSSSSSSGGGAQQLDEAAAASGESGGTDGGGWVSQRRGDAIRLVGEMNIDKPAYLQVQEGRNGRSDTLLVSQFGFTRGGAVSRVDLDPPPQLPRMFARLEGAVGGSAAAAAAAAVGGGVLSRRTQPRLTGTWAGPLLWPNEVNQVGAAGCLAWSLVRWVTAGRASGRGGPLSVEGRGREAELKYLATRNGSSSSSSSSSGRQRQDSSTSRANEGGSDGLAGSGETNGNAGGAHVQQPLRFESQQFSLLRLESDKFSDGDCSPRKRRETEAAALPLPVTGAGAGGAPQVPPGTAEPSLLQDGRNAAGTSASTESPPTTLPGWDGPLLPEDGDAVLIADGFLVPGKADGGVYLVVPAAAEERRAAGGGVGVDGAARGRESRAGGKAGAGAAAAVGSSPTEDKIVRLTNPKRGWFYHKAVWVVLPGGKKVVLTARVHKPIFGQAEGELVLLEMPRVDHPLSEQNLPWREKVLVTGPDVMFEVVDLDREDSTVQVICAEFFGGRVTMHSLWGGGQLPGSQPSVTESWVLDDNAGPAYSITAADLRGGSPGGRPTHFLVTVHESSYNTYSLFAGAGGIGGNGGGGSSSKANFNPAAAAAAATSAAAGSRHAGVEPDPAGIEAEKAAFRVPSEGTSRWEAGRWGGVVAGGPKERRWQRREEGRGNGGAGGSLVAYEIPEDWRMLPRFYPAPGWLRATLASGFRVRGISINPGTPGFPYLFHPHRSMEGKQPPYIAIAGDCSQSAYILRPAPAASGSAGTAAGGGPETKGAWEQEAAPLGYEIACAIEVPGTVGSLAVSYGQLLGEDGTMEGFDTAEPPSPPHPPVASPEVFLEGAGRRRREEGVRPSPQPQRRGADGWAKLFVPNYDGNKIYIFSMEPAMQ